MEEFRIYQVWPSCPSISISGSKCLLLCEHCKAKYLRFMHSAERGEELTGLARRLAQKGAKGFLISGGCDQEGNLLNLKKMLPAIKEIHSQGFVIKLHTGFVDRELAEELASSIDIASMEFPGSISAIKEIFNLNSGIDKYIQTFRNLHGAGVEHIVPHICIGLEHGRLSDEIFAIKTLKEIFVPEKIVFIVFIPTPGTPCSNDNLPLPGDVKKVFRYARELLPETDLVLGALRPRFFNVKGVSWDYIHEVEMASIEGGANGIEVPSRKTLEFLRKNYRLLEIEAFGALPACFESKFIKNVSAWQ